MNTNGNLVINNETRPLIANRSMAKSSKAEFLLKIGNNTCSVLIGVPVGVLSALSVLCRDNGMVLGSLKTPGDFINLISDGSSLNLFQAGLAFVAGGGVTVFIAKKHLLPAVKEVVNLFKGMMLVCCRKEGGKQRFSLVDLALLIWSSCTALIFAKIGSQALSFLDTPGEVSGFILKFLLAAPTRYLASKVVLKQRFNKNWRLKQQALSQLSYLSKTQLAGMPSVPIAEGADICAINQAVKSYLKQESVQSALKKRTVRKTILKEVSGLLAASLFFITIMPMAVCFIPKAVQGLELMFGVDIGKKEGYQNATTFLIGAFFSLLSDIFYELSTVSLPYTFFNTVFAVKDHYSEGNHKQVGKMMFLTALTMAMSYGNAIGIGFVASSLAKEGFLSYLGETVGHQLVPVGLTMVTMTMVWSNLQKLINSNKKNQAISANKQGLFAIKEVSGDNIRGLLANNKVNITDPTPTQLTNMV